MKYFLVEGNIIDVGGIANDIMKEHMTYTGAAMRRGMTFTSGLQVDMSGSLSVMKAEEGGC